MTNEPRKEFNSSDSPAPAPRPAREDGPRRPYGPRKHFAPRRKVCRLCAEKILHVDYKQVQIVKSFCADGGKILSRRITGACARHQRQIAKAVKVNRNLAIMPYSG
jgi:small subunit ribosomal protein S18